MAHILAINYQAIQTQSPLVVFLRFFAIDLNVRQSAQLYRTPMETCFRVVCVSSRMNVIELFTVNVSPLVWYLFLPFMYNLLGVWFFMNI